MRRRDLLAAAAMGLGGCVRPNNDHGSFSLVDTGLDEMAAGLHTGRWTSRALTRWYLDRIESVDRRQKLGAVLSVNPRALEEAASLDAELKARGPRGVLHGIPVLVKDNIETAGAMATTAGSLALERWFAPADAAVVARLRARGALVFGKTNLSEWANFRSTRSVSGWSGVGGQTRNPHALDRSASGSSSGSGAAVAASLCGVAVGTETDGSIVSPASVCGIVGVKPTVGLIEAAGIVPIAASQDTAGPMARTVRDAAILLSAMVGKRTDYTRALDPRGLQGARIGVVRSFFERNERVNAFLTRQVDVLKRLGATVVDEVPLRMGEVWDAEFQVLLSEFKAGLSAYLAKLPAGMPARTIAELIAFNEKNRGREMALFGQEILLKAEAQAPLTEKKYVDARALCLRLMRDEGLDAAMKKERLDALVAPTSGPAWLIDEVNGDYDTGGSSTPAAVAGYPHVTVPAGMVGGLPVGLSFFGAAWSEALLLKFAYAYERETGARVRPGMKKTV